MSRGSFQDRLNRIDSKLSSGDSIDFSGGTSMIDTSLRSRRAHHRKIGRIFLWIALVPVVLFCAPTVFGWINASAQVGFTAADTQQKNPIDIPPTAEQLEIWSSAELQERNLAIQTARRVVADFGFYRFENDLTEYKPADAEEQIALANIQKKYLPNQLADMEPAHAVARGVFVKSLFFSGTLNHPDPYDYLPPADANWLRIDLRDLIHEPSEYYAAKETWLASGRDLNWASLSGLRAFLQAQDFRGAIKGNVAYSLYIKRGDTQTILVRHDWVKGEKVELPNALKPIEEQRVGANYWRASGDFAEPIEIRDVVFSGLWLAPEISHFYSFEPSELVKYGTTLTRDAQISLVTNVDDPAAIAEFLGQFDFGEIIARDTAE